MAGDAHRCLFARLPSLLEEENQRSRIPARLASLRWLCGAAAGGCHRRRPQSGRRHRTAARKSDRPDHHRGGRSIVQHSLRTADCLLRLVDRHAAGQPEDAGDYRAFGRSGRAGICGGPASRGQDRQDQRRTFLLHLGAVRQQDSLLDRQGRSGSNPRREADHHLLHTGGQSERAGTVAQRKNRLALLPAAHSAGTGTGKRLPGGKGGHQGRRLCRGD